jgi:hypothetical protein
MTTKPRIAIVVGSTRPGRYADKAAGWMLKQAQAIDSKLRACDLTKLRVRDIAHGEHVSSRAIVMQQKTQHPVQFEITEGTWASRSMMLWKWQSRQKSDHPLRRSRLDRRYPTLSSRWGW